MAVDTSGLEAALRDLAIQASQRLGDEFVSRAQGRCSRRSGNLANSIVADGPADNGSVISNHVIVGEDYGQYQDEGTGVFGPEGHRIEGSPLLAFDWPAAGGLVIVHSIAGAPGTHFWSETVNEWPDIVAAA